MKDKNNILKFITCGSVDDGKSTLIGRILYESQLILEDQFEILKNDFMKIYENYDVFKKNINRKNIDISNTAENYIQFCEDILSKIDEN